MHFMVQLLFIIDNLELASLNKPTASTAFGRSEGENDSIHDLLHASHPWMLAIPEYFTGKPHA